MISLEMCPAVSFSAEILTIPAAFFESDPPQKTYTPVGLRAPEQILGDPASRAADIWAFGILVFEIVRGHTVFEFASRAKDRDNIDDEHLLDMSTFVGPLPESLYQRWTRSLKYFTPERVLYNKIVSMETWDSLGYDPDPLENNRSPMEEEFDDGKPTSLSAEETAAIKSLIRRALQYDPAKRPTTSELLEDLWFTTEFERVLTEEVIYTFRACPRLAN
jgi:serine/threonine protein kinase